jgi:hypothetical protein
MRPRLVKNAFDDPDYIFELEHNGFRALAYMDEVNAASDRVISKSCPSNRHGRHSRDASDTERNCRWRDACAGPQRATQAADTLLMEDQSLRHTEFSLGQSVSSHQRTSFAALGSGFGGIGAVESRTLSR